MCGDVAAIVADYASEGLFTVSGSEMTGQVVPTRGGHWWSVTKNHGAVTVQSTHFSHSATVPANGSDCFTGELPDGSLLVVRGGANPGRAFAILRSGTAVELWNKRVRVSLDDACLLHYDCGSTEKQLELVTSDPDGLVFLSALMGDVLGTFAPPPTVRFRECRVYPAHDDLLLLVEREHVNVFSRRSAAIVKRWKCVAGANLPGCTVVFVPRTQTVKMLFHVAGLVYSYDLATGKLLHTLEFPGQGGISRIKTVWHSSGDSAVSYGVLHYEPPLFCALL